MPTPLSQKSTLAEIEQRFDHDVERFSNLDTGQVATIDAPLAMELITAAALAATPVVTRILDIGCGAGNNTIKLLRCHGGNFDCDLNDLSMPMLMRAQQRVGRETSGRVEIVQGDFRTVPFVDGGYDIILAAAVLHHLRDDQDWLAAFTKIHSLLRPKGSFWVTDLVSHEIDPVERLMWRRYGDYLEATGGEAYREKVVRYIDREDSPRPVTFQLDLMRRVGFSSVDLLHKNSCFAAFGGVRE
ncbi:MAG: class I SAM-dependent methyltransferase [Desulfobulbus sp.]|jgi:tRNA (cmo5U34)-methyltransferase|uniref:class I SAM-dependent methyltransferase n=1 Tax=Desulfobulbus sp. TaxID=895 RepID=UPI002851C26D|nr:class I SAM-dependent methyltransferase [Desulfobulbus sp.]MDR2549522.1 class I SAM-dependent methyltransferase [Desulfobulbus sp.]